MADLNKLSTVKNYVQRPGDTFLRDNSAKIIKKLGIKDGETSKIAALAINAAQQAAALFSDDKERYNQLLDLSSRGSLIVNYDGPEGAPDGAMIFIPFYENPIIKESNTAKYTTRNIFGRNSPLRNFVGAGPRKFEVSIPYNLDHLASFDYSRINKQIDFSSKMDISLKKYVTDVLQAEENERAVRAKGGFLSNASRQVDNFIDKYGRIELSKKGIENKYNQLFGDKPEDTASRLLGAYYTILEVVRSLVLTDVNQPWIKPPVVRLKFGDWMDNIQCITTDYSIERDEDAGYDVNTLLPKRIIYTLSLEEYVSLPTGKVKDVYGLPGSDKISSILRKNQLARKDLASLKLSNIGNPIGPGPITPSNPVF